MPGLHSSPAELSLRAARRRYFDDNGFGPNGGYDEPWVDFKLGPIPFPFPNTASRVKAVGYHDLHHILTGYQTDLVGEFEISAWEIAAGCGSYAAAWVLNLGGMAGGLFLAPRRIFAAFVRGRRQRTLYGLELEPLLERTVAEVREAYAPAAESKATLSDCVLFVLAAALGQVVGLLTFALVVPLVPIGLVTHALRRTRSG